MSADPLSKRQAIQVFVAFAGAYFLSTLVRAITATLSPVLSTELALDAGDLGLLAGAYFFGFALTQLPLGAWLDCYGPKRMVLSFLSLVVLGCLAFALAESFPALLLARVLCGVGLSACLMAPLTAYRRWYAPNLQMRANAWMLMSGSLGVVTSTLPVQHLLPLLGWRGIFVCLAGLLALAMFAIQWVVPRWQTAAPVDAAQPTGYAAVWRHAYFQKMVPLGFFMYGGLIAVQTLWAGPWLSKVAGLDPAHTAQGLFVLNLCLLAAYWWWGWVNPRWAARGWGSNTLIRWGAPLALVLLLLTVLAPVQTAVSSAVPLVLYSVACTVVSLAQPSVGMAFVPALAGRALSAYNLVIFTGIFAMQWGMGLVIDGLRAKGYSEVQALQGAFAGLGLLSLLAYLYFLHRSEPSP